MIRVEKEEAKRAGSRWGEGEISDAGEFSREVAKITEKKGGERIEMGLALIEIGSFWSL